MTRRALPPFTCLFCRHSSTLLRPASRPYATRPSFAPKPTLPIKHIARNPGLYEQNALDRNYAAASRNSWQILELTRARTAAQHAALAHRQRSRALNEELKALAAVRAKTPADTRRVAALLAEARQLKATLAGIDAAAADREQQLEALALALPNLSSVHTPEGAEPRLLAEWAPAAAAAGLGPTNVHARDHADVGAQLGLLDLAAGAATSGWGWYFLDGALAELEDALVAYALGVVKRRRGWVRSAPPCMVYAHVGAACGFQPRDEGAAQQVYAVEREEPDEVQRVLAGTAEIPLAGRFAGAVLEEERLPIKMVGSSRCFRAEAGARGADGRGLYRVHEFTKVEMFAWTMPDEVELEEGEGGFDTREERPEGSASEAVFEEMVAIQREILEGLELPFRVIEMPAADLGASASRKIDMEVLFPSRLKQGKNEGWGEVTSVSICTDYQSRRLGTRVKRKDGETRTFPHTINGTAMAVPRVLAALLEHGWDEEGQYVRVPQVLQKWMNGLEAIRKKA